MFGQAYIFINYEQALKFGHVAWGFALDEETYCYGSSDHLLKRPMSDLPAMLKYSHVEPGGDIDFWSEKGNISEMLHTMKRGHHIRYHAYKSIGLAEFFPDAARAEMEKVAAGGWSVLTNNCIHHTYRILHAYGVNGVNQKLLLPQLSKPRTLMPKHWFSHADANDLSSLTSQSYSSKKVYQGL